MCFYDEELIWVLAVSSWIYCQLSGCILGFKGTSVKLCAVVMYHLEPLYVSFFLLHMLVFSLQGKTGFLKCWFCYLNFIVPISIYDNLLPNFRWLSIKFSFLCNVIVNNVITLSLSFSYFRRKCDLIKRQSTVLNFKETLNSAWEV